ncbi:MAG TPA: hypothetical protein VMS17_09105 [Gemmataceae bacterium]|nr:hypothetical protein [Gemmataceae bacterium]
MKSLAEAVQVLEQFTKGNLRGKIASIEQILRLSGQADCRDYLARSAITSDLFTAALLLKQAAGQINEVIHAVAILLLLPNLLQEGEKVEYLSLAAGNTGKPFDLETSHRIAEFKFIQWRGGSQDARRQDNLFQDFFNVAEHQTTKLKCLYVWGTTIPLTFLNGRRSIESVCRNRRLWDRFRATYGERFRVVADYYSFRRDEVSIRDVGPLLNQVGVADLLPLSDEARDVSAQAPRPRKSTRCEIFGHSATAVIRWMGANRWSFADCRAALAAHGAAGTSDATIQTQLRAGRKGERGPAATITSTQAEELAACRRK